MRPAPQSAGQAFISGVARSLLGAALAAIFVSALDTTYAVAGHGYSQGPSFGSVVLTEIGLIGPLALVVGLVIGIVLLFLDPVQERSPLAWVRAWRHQIDAVTACLAVFAAGVATVVVAHGARRMLSMEAPSTQTGAELALLASTTALVSALSVAALAPLLSRALAFKRVGINSIALASVALAAVGLAFAYGIACGAPGGQEGVLGIFGVLKRQELDLRAPGLLIGIALGAALGTMLFRRFFAPLALALALVPLVMTLRAAVELDRSAALTATVERDAPLGKLALGILRMGTDHDRDGFSRTFGGGDCNDHDAQIFPTAIDIPGNRVDEDCSGSDAQSVGSADKAAESNSNAPTRQVPQAPQGLNVLLITIDTLRADLGFAGYPRPVSPSLDAFAAKSVVFDNAYSLASYTGKSIGPMMIGKYPSECHRGWGHFNSYSKEDTMVAERLSAAGIRTLSVQAHWYFDRPSGLGRGFDILDRSAAPNPGAQQDTDTTVTSDKLTDAAIEQLSDSTLISSRFFGWVHYLDPHADYLHHPDTQDFGRGMRDMYDHEVAFTDHHVGRLLDWVSKQPWAAHTALVITSDHGEAFGEHKLIRHGFELWEELVRVPLLVWVPGAAPHRVTPRRSAIDLVPTLLGLFHIEPALHTTSSDYLSGESLLPDILNPADTPFEERDVFIDMPAGPHNDERRAFYHRDRKLSSASGVRYQLFDLATDPGEKKDLAESDQQAVVEMRTRYDAFRAKLHEVYVKPIAKEDR